MKRSLLLLAYCAIVALVFAPAAVAQQLGPGEDLDCSQVGPAGASPEGVQEEAQALLADDPTDPNSLDSDGDGVACEFEQNPTGSVKFEDGTGFTTDATSAAPSTSKCEDFASQAEAQAALEAVPGNPDSLDADGDGLACEGVPYSPTEPDVAASPTQTEEGQDLDCVGLLEAQADPEQETSPEGAQEQAQALLADDPTDPNGLDGDGDGVACEFEQSPIGTVAFEDGTGFAETVTSAEEPQQYATPSPTEEAEPVAPSEAPHGSVAQPSSTGQNFSPTELPATGGYTPLPGANTAFFGTTLVASSILVLAVRRRQAS